MALFSMSTGMYLKPLHVLLVVSLQLAGSHNFICVPFFSEPMRKKHYKD